MEVVSNKATNLPARHCPPLLLPRVFADDATRAGFKEQRPVRSFSSGAEMGQAAQTILIVMLALCSGAVVMLAFPGEGHKNDDLLARDGRRYDSVCVCMCVRARARAFHSANLSVTQPAHHQIVR